MKERRVVRGVLVEASLPSITCETGTDYEDGKAAKVSRSTFNGFELKVPRISITME
jgi:hypothetical protein